MCSRTEVLVLDKGFPAIGGFVDASSGVLTSEAACPGAARSDAAGYNVVRPRDAAGSAAASPAAASPAAASPDAASPDAASHYATNSHAAHSGVACPSAANREAVCPDVPRNRARLAVVGIGAAAGAALLVAASVLSGGVADPGVVVPVALASLCAWVAIDDLRTLTIPDLAVVAIALIGAALRIFGAADDPLAVTTATVGADLAMSGGLLWLVRELGYRRRGYDILGFGDVKLSAAFGLLLGAEGFAMALLAASLTGLAIALARALWRRALHRNAKLPFGALLAPAAFIVWWIAGPVPTVFFD